MIRKLLRASLSIVLVLIASRAAAQSGNIGMHSTGYPDSVAITITVNDPGGLPSCPYLAVIRANYLGAVGPIIAIFNRHPGTTTVHHVVDTNVLPSTEYCYRMALPLFPAPVPIWCGGDVSSLCQVFNCFCDISTCANTGPDPFLVGRGFLSTLNGGGDTTCYLYPCSGDPNPIAGFCGALGTAAAFVDSGIAVDVYAQPETCFAQCFWGMKATAATPQSCVVAVEATSWGAVKALYRE